MICTVSIKSPFLPQLYSSPFPIPLILFMREHQEFKLNSSLFHSSFKDKHLNIHRVRNSILRNVVTEPSDQDTIDRHNQNYQKYLKLNPLYKDELAQFLRCICENPERSVPNKNVIKRVMIDFFNDDVMGNIKGEEFFNKIVLREWKRGVYEDPDQKERHFYLVLKGRLVFRNGVSSTKVKARECYGHEEIVCGERISEIEVVSDAVVFVVEEAVFAKCLKQSFQNKLKVNGKKLSKHPCFEYMKQQFEINKLLLRMMRKEFVEGEMMANEGDEIQEVYFLVKGKLECSNQHIHRIKGIGLKEVSNCQKVYQSTIYAKTACEVLSLPISIFRRTYYIKWIRSTIPDQPRFVMINIDEIGKDNKSSFKVRKTSMSIKKSNYSEIRDKPQTQPVSFSNKFLFLNEKPERKRS